MEHIQIFTNNPAVRAAYPDTVYWVDGAVADVFTAVRDAVHTGAKVLSHPLSGSIKPWQSPYKSIAVSRSAGALCFGSLQRIESAIAALNKGTQAVSALSESVLEDFQIIDLDLIKNVSDNPR
ncbi:MAG: GrdX family protein [Defluviitaleaceae bacterium]|nr:GrdX family protein [Defluviitaleaceae bacterium]MCL2274950.1 GrdX family protein [Defluviitaleaceae bacterium]